MTARGFQLAFNDHQRSRASRTEPLQIFCIWSDSHGATNTLWRRKHRVFSYIFRTSAETNVATTSSNTHPSAVRVDLVVVVGLRKALIYGSGITRTNSFRSCPTYVCIQCVEGDLSFDPLLRLHPPPPPGAYDPSTNCLRDIDGGSLRLNKCFALIQQVLGKTPNVECVLHHVILVCYWSVGPLVCMIPLSPAPVPLFLPVSPAKD